MNHFVIRPLASAAEARCCAGFMAASEPWLTLGFTADQLYQRITDPKCEVHVAETGNQIIGVLILDLSGPLNGYIRSIAVAPGWQNRGFGKQLMHFAEERIFRQSPNVFLCVSSFNHRAQQLYERLGYQRVGELKNYLLQGCSEILMRKTKGPLLTFTPGK